MSAVFMCVRNVEFSLISDVALVNSGDKVGHKCL